MAQRNDDRLEYMILFFAAKAPDGKTKMAKYLWEADVEAFRRFGRSLSGRDLYLRLEHGPVPQNFDKALAKLREEGLLAREFLDKYGYREERHHLADDAAVDFSVFSPEEVDVLHTAIVRLQDLSARQASERTHDAYWEELALGGRMFVSAGAVVEGEVTEEALAWAESVRKEIIEEEASLQEIE